MIKETKEEKLRKRISKFLDKECGNKSYYLMIEDEDEPIMRISRKRNFLFAEKLGTKSAELIQQFVAAEKAAK